MLPVVADTGEAKMASGKGPIASLFVILFAGACLVLTLFMPWAELGLPVGKEVPEILQAMAGLFEQVKQSAPELVGKLEEGDPNLQYYLYSIFLALAMCAAALGLGIVGRDENSDEKTVLPVKK